MTWPENRPPSHLPARGTGTRPPMQPGNLARLSHGARAPRVYGALAQRLAAGLLEDRPDLGSYPEAVAAWASAEAQAALMRRHLADVGPIDPDTGEPRPGALKWLVQFERLALAARVPLGLDPLSEAALARTRAEAATYVVDLDAIAERGRQALAKRQDAAADLAGEVLAEQGDAYAVERAEAAAKWAATEGGRA